MGDFKKVGGGILVMGDDFKMLGDIDTPLWIMIDKIKLNTELLKMSQNVPHFYLRGNPRLNLGQEFNLLANQLCIALAL